MFTAGILTRSSEMIQPTLVIIYAVSFFVSGYIVDPKNSYHLEILEKDSRENIEEIKKILNNILRIKAGITEHKKGMKLYLKKIK